jgi:hypothetical protein
MKELFRGVELAALVMMAAAPAFADDGSAALAAGGIVFTKNTSVRMAREDLYMSPKLVRVRFEFANDTDKDVETVVAFPLPDIDNREYFLTEVGIPTENPENFVGFQAWVDGKRIDARIEQTAFIMNRDVTTIVRAAGLPLNVIVTDNSLKQFDEMPEAKRKQLIANGVLADNGVPLWTVRTKFYWNQRFPAHKTVVIGHSYQPVTGGTSNGESLIDDTAGHADFCFNAATKAQVAVLAAAKRKAAKNDLGVDSVVSYDTAYILKTANSWNGSIERFHLTLDKLKPGNVLSLCWDGALKKTGPTTFEDIRRNFAPERDIHMVVFE